jgi:5-hydroxyisourate hydrolase
MSTVTTHVLDTSLGRPAPGIRVSLERLGEVLGSGVTDADGRIRNLHPPGATLAEGDYRLVFAVAEYFSRTGREIFYPEIVVNIHIGSNSEQYHVPLLLSPFGYSTYRGS